MQNKNVKQEKLNRREWLNDYLRILEKSCSDFPDVKFAFEKAYLELRENMSIQIKLSNILMIC